MNAVWFTWENQRRNRELSKALGVKLFEFKEIDDMKNPVRKYSRGLLRTGRALLREKPPLVFCQNPSLVLSSFLVTIKKLQGFRVCVDAHNVGLFPKEGRSRMLGGLAGYVQRKADLTLVTNEHLQRHVEQNGGRAFVLQDRIPDIRRKPPVGLKGRYNVLFICSYADDEPYQMVFDAAEKLDAGIHIYVTGNYRKRNLDPSHVPPNVTLMGYISEDLYVDMLNSVDATIDLTSRENCLVCGAYETVAVEKPQILSDTRALRDYFNRGAVYTPHTVEGIRRSVVSLIENRPFLEKEAIELKRQRQAEWELKKNALQAILSEMVQ